MFYGVTTITQEAPSAGRLRLTMRNLKVGDMLMRPREGWRMGCVESVAPNLQQVKVEGFDQKFTIRTLIGFGLQIERCPATTRRLKIRLAARRLYAQQKRKQIKKPRIVFWPIHEDDPKPWKLVSAFRCMEDAKAAAGAANFPGAFWRNMAR